VNQKESNDFELRLKVPDIGELTVKLHPDAWNRLHHGLKPWYWMMATVLGGTIGINLMRPSIPMPPQLPIAPPIHKIEPNP
jgi:hypothetical protein